MHARPEAETRWRDPYRVKGLLTRRYGPHDRFAHHGAGDLAIASATKDASGSDLRLVRGLRQVVRRHRRRRPDAPSARMHSPSRRADVVGRRRREATQRLVHVLLRPIASR